MALLLAVCLPPIIFSVCFIAVIAFYSWDVIMGPRKGEEGKARRPPAVSDLDEFELNGASIKHVDFVPQSLSWNGISLTIKSGSGQKEILKGCAGEVLPGEMMAIVGPSGAGKSTLLDILANRLKPTSGKIWVGSQRMDSSFSRISTYVPQEDSFVPTLSVWETLALTSRLRLPSHVSTAERYQLMDNILQSMGLAKVRHSQVGGLLPGGLYVRGISGGERRRLNISCGIVAAPSIIFLDEPTSGLDSHAALVLMRYMGRLAGLKRTIICSIHQPRQSIWDLFHKLELLSEGYLLYFGVPKGAVPWFSDTLGYSYRPTRDGTASDWLLDLVSIGFEHGGPKRDPMDSPSESQSPKRERSRGMTSIVAVREAAETFKEHGYPLMIHDEAFLIKESMGETGEVPSTQGLLKKSLAPRKEGGEEGRVAAYPTSFWNQLVCLMWRTLMSQVRNPADVASRLLMCLVTGGFCGLVFINANTKDAMVQTIMAVLFFCLLVIMLYPFNQMSLYMADRQFFISDIASKLYRPEAYFLATTLVAAPFNMVGGLVLFLVAYGIIGLRYHPTVILVSCCCIALFSVICIQILVLSAYISPTQDIAYVVATVYVMFSMLWAGLFVKLRELLAPLRAISYITPCRYASQIIIRQQFVNTTKQSTLKVFDLEVPDSINFAALFAIYAVLLALTLLALRNLCRAKGK